MRDLIILGTGFAQATRCYNTCFAIRGGGGVFLVDAGGGNEILRRLEAAQISLGDIKAMFVTHAHIDHILGVMWIIRMVNAAMKSGKIEGELPIYCHNEVRDALQYMCDNLLANGSFGFAGGRIKLIEVKDGDNFSALGMDFTAFDIFSTKKKQFGFAGDVDGERLVCLGDEPLEPRCRRYAQGADILMCESFCLTRDEGKYKPHSKSHGTVLEAARTAQDLGVGRLLIYHTEDSDIAHRKENYTAEAQQAFSGQIYVPDDMDVLQLGRR